ncbi:hypothetical protein SPF06_18560 [Sinomonas sp. JGH33]|uniref:Uncharacterized protein n=1 Tax=Sinomonas terricola TaxID=3110330 RepID=A0ABU5TAR2_9MICC|nr:hypothetical protein [Sinomonas sp. JGH33]MEA5456730.1 hypothetical protein [Sinomonas sp. JGH33]
MKLTENPSGVQATIARDDLEQLLAAAESWHSELVDYIEKDPGNGHDGSGSDNLWDVIGRVRRQHPATIVPDHGRRLRTMRDEAADPLARDILTRFIAAPEAAAAILLENFAFLGSKTEWNGGDFLEGFALDARKLGLPRVGDQSREELRAWRSLALALGHDADALGFDPCSECGDDLEDSAGEGYDGLCGDCADQAERQGRWSHHYA